jgi:protein phosphatase
MKLNAWGKTDTGRRRDHNEDNYLVDEELRLFAVADGMGGHQGGETASRMVLDVLRERISDSIADLEEAAAELEMDPGSTMPMGGGTFDEETSPVRRAALARAETERPAEETATDPMMMAVTPPASVVMQAAAREAGMAIFDASRRHARLRGMGTTLTAMLYDAGRMHMVHAGDSRAYLFRDEQLEQLTDDHSWIAEQVRLGAMTEEEARESRFRHIITRSVGFEREVELDTYGIPVEPGDCFLLCSDGMSNYIHNEELEHLLGVTWFRRAPELFIELANERGGDDNITVVVVHIANHTL